MPDEERPFLVDPLTAYPRTVDPASRDAVRAAFRALDSGPSLADVEARATELLARDPSFAPAEVLRAQAETLRGDLASAAERLEPIVGEMPDYLAAALLLARLEERRDRLVEAYALYRRLGDLDRRSAARAGALRDEAEARVRDRIDEALDAGRLDQAQELLARLEEWSPGARTTLEAALQVAVAGEDAEAELTVLRRLTALDPTLESRQRLGELELEVGDLRAGLELFEALRDEAPDDPVIADALERAKFLWRMELLPARVLELARAPELNRADLASVLHWLVPMVRLWEVRDPPIAGDIVDRPERGEIVRVLDLELMQVDERLHRFYPERPATRAEALDAVLVLLSGAEPPASCLPAPPPRQRGHRWICAKASACGLIDDESECLATIPVSGAEAVELVRRGLDRSSDRVSEHGTASGPVRNGSGP